MPSHGSQGDRTPRCPRCEDGGAVVSDGTRHLGNTYKWLCHTCRTKFETANPFGLLAKLVEKALS